MVKYVMFLIYILVSWKFFDNNNKRMINFVCLIYFFFKYGYGIIIFVCERSDFI